MLFVCWSPKGGVGTSVVAAALALRAAADGRETLLVDLAGDQVALLGLPGPVGEGVGDWLAGGDDVPIDALPALEVDVVDRLRLLPRGGGCEPARLPVLGAVLGGGGRTVVVDAGLGSPPAWAGRAATSVLVMRACYLAVRRAGVVPADTRLVLIEEPGRALRAADVAAALGVDPWVRLTADPAVGRAVDAGLIACRPPRSLRALRVDR